MPELNTSTASTILGIRTGHHVRLIGGSPEFDTALEPLPEGVTLTHDNSEPADIGLIVINDEADLRERLSTELDTLTGAAQVWMITRTSAGPDDAVIRVDAYAAGWHATSSTFLAGGWLAVNLQKN